MALLINIGGDYAYQNYDVIKNMVRYITRTNGMSRSDLIGYGGSGVLLNKGIRNMIYSLESIQNIWNVGETYGPRVYHYVLDLTTEETMRFNDDNKRICRFADACSDYFFNKGYQCVYGIHKNEEKGSIHIHLMISTINFRTGLHYSSEHLMFPLIEHELNNILLKHSGVNMLERIR